MLNLIHFNYNKAVMYYVVSVQGFCSLIGSALCLQCKGHAFDPQETHTSENVQNI